MTDADFTEWLKSPGAVRCLLVEVSVKLSTGSVVTRYLSNRGYTTTGVDTPANKYYEPRVVGGIKITKSIALDGKVSLSFGDIELNNQDGGIDDWLEDFWANRNLSIYLGDVQWARSDFRPVFQGVTTGIDSRTRNRVNIKLSDKLQRLNNPATEEKLGGMSNFSDNLLPLLFGECYNIEPLLTDPATNEYQVHDGAIERIIEVRDNGAPVSFTELASTGKFRLNQQPYGQITCSAQGALIPTDILYASTGSDLANTGRWSRGALSSVSLPTDQPFPGLASAGIVPNATNAIHYLNHTQTTSPSSTYVFSAYVKAASGATAFDLHVNDPDGSNAFAQCVLTFATGVVTTQTNAAFNVGGVILDAQAVQLSNGWWRMWLKYKPPTGTTQTRHRPRVYNASGTNTFTGDGTTVYGLVAGVLIERGNLPAPTSYDPIDIGDTTTAVYRNTAVDLVRYISSNYGTATGKLTSTDFDYESLMQFDNANRQPLGIYLKERANVLDVVTQLASSLGAAPVINQSGLLYLVKLQLPQPTTGTVVTSSDMLDRSLQISQFADVVAGVQIGYCKNWTPQTTIAAGIVGDGSALFGEEWLTTTATDTLARDNYNLFTEPEMIPTLLLTAPTAILEADRRLDIFSTQRKVYKYTGFYHLIGEELGAPQTIFNSRFGLSAGKTGQIISISVDLINPHVDFTVLI